MKMTELGRSGIRVTDYCLGTMTFGTQTTEAEGHAQIDRAADAGINFMDTAEMYPVNPVRVETMGVTETIIGNWFAKSGRRNDWVIATKHVGKRDDVRDGADIGPATVRASVEGSLKRLQTDMIDLYQFHWPNRGSYHFRRHWVYDPTTQRPRSEIVDNMTATMETLGELVKEGKIRAFGLSNETAWGTMEWIAAAERTGGPRPASIQNEYSLLCRYYDKDLAEVGHHEDVTLLAFSPLAAGLLTGKYQGGAIPDGSRRTLVHDLGGRITDRVFGAVQAYLDVAEAHGIDPVHLALAFTVQRPAPTIPIVGATTLAQLDHIIAGLDVTLGEDVLDAVLKAHKAHPLPY